MTTSPTRTAPAGAVAQLVHSRGPGVRGALVEIAFVAIALVVDVLVRWSTLDDFDLAVANAHDLLALQQRLGLDWEHAAQDAADQVPGLSTFLSWFYVLGYFPLLIGVLLWLYAHRPTAYAVLRNALLVSGAVGMLGYAFYPLAPPRLTDLGYADPVASGALDAAARPVGIANEIGAMPSFHVGWLMLAAIALVPVVTHLLVRIVAVAVPLVMGVAVVATGNHWVLDIPAGVAVALVGLWVARRLERWASRRLGPPAAGG